ncbi:MAG: hypothetical protein EOO38_22945, partial [Cytophagaceae bacterium]
MHENAYHVLEAQVARNSDAAAVAYTVDSFADAYTGAAVIAQQIQDAEAFIEARVDVSAAYHALISPRDVAALAVQIQGAPFVTQPGAPGWDELVVTGVQYEQGTHLVAAAKSVHLEAQTALLDSAALFIAGADQQFSQADVDSGRAFLRLAQEGIELALSIGVWVPGVGPAVAGVNLARTVAEYIVGYDLLTHAPVHVDTLDTVSLAMALMPGVGKPFARLGKALSRLTQGETKVSKTAKQTLHRVLRGKSEKDWATRGDDALGKILNAKSPKDLPLTEYVEAAGKLNKGEETFAGRALRKHNNRPGSIFGGHSGNSNAFNIRGQEIVRDILWHPDSSVRVWMHPSDGYLINIKTPDQGGVQFY